MRLLRFAGRCVQTVRSFVTNVVPSLIIDGVGLLGATAISYGAWEIYRPVGFIVAGILMLAFAFMIAGRSR
jgi:hypothetical protein